MTRLADGPHRHLHPVRRPGRQSFADRLAVDRYERIVAAQDEAKLSAAQVEAFADLTPSQADILYLRSMTAPAPGARARFRSPVRTRSRPGILARLLRWCGPYGTTDWLTMAVLIAAAPCGYGWALFATAPPPDAATPPPDAALRPT
jgi:hypothetical protein